METTLTANQLYNQSGIAAYPSSTPQLKNYGLYEHALKTRGSDLESASGEDIDQVAEVVYDAGARVDNRRVSTVEPPAVDLAVEVGADVGPCACTESPPHVPPQPPPNNVLPMPTTTRPSRTTCRRCSYVGMALRWQCGAHRRRHCGSCSRACGSR